MFLGHFAVGLAAKRAAPGVSLGVLFAAGQLADLVWPILVLAGVEHVRIVPGITAATPLDLYDYPYSHSLVALVGWGLLAAGAYFAWKRDRRGAIIVGAVVLSHWLLDFVAHRPDLPVLPHGPYLGLGMWESVPLTLAVELGLFAGAAALYLRATRPTDKKGSLGFWTLLAFLGVTYLGAIFGPPPPSDTAVAVSANSIWLVALWAAWADRHRAPAPGG